VKEAIELIENDVLGGASLNKTRFRRDILRIFSKWHKEPLTPKRVHQLLDEEGHRVKMDTVRDNLEVLTKKSILRKTTLLSNGKPGRPSDVFSLRKEAIFEIFKLTEDLVDAMDFAQIDGESDKPRVGKFVNYDGKNYKSFRDPDCTCGVLAVVHRRAKEEDFEKSWRLAEHIKELQNYCQTDSSAYKEYEEIKFWERCKALGLRPGD
jgi:hypothetical protein